MMLFSDPSVGIADPMLRRAYALAERGRGTVSPNPLVGCVVVRNGEVVGEGFHQRAGGPHAEVVALDMAGERANGADVYATLEPCNHFGKTPPCVDRLLSAGVRSVTIGMPDPNPEVTGGGADALTAGGVRIAWAEDPSVFEAQNEAWLTRVRLGRPFVTVKVALTLDGRPTLAASRRSQITGAGGRSVTMRLRSAATAVAVGAATVSVDNPRLTVRDDDDAPSEHTPARYVLSRTSVPDSRAMLFTDGRAATTLVTSDAAHGQGLAALAQGGTRILVYPYREGLRAALHLIAEDGVNDLLIESGPALFSALWRDRLIDELILITAGGMCGNAAPPLFLGQPDAAGCDLAPVVRPVETGIVNGDVVTVWRPLG